jgi:hypothetical protein
MATTPQPDIFDQVAAGNGVTQPSTPTTAGSAPPSTPASSGDLFDQAAAQHDGSFQTPATRQTLTPGTLVHVNGHAGVAKGINPDTGKVIVDWGSKPRWNPFSTPEENISEVSPSDLDATPNAFSSAVAGTGTSLVKTAQGAAKIVHAPKQVQQTLANDQQQLTDAKNVNPLAGGAGSLAGDVLQFLAGDAALKAGTEATSLSDLMQQSGKIAKAVEKFPALAKALQTGLRAGTVQGTLGTVSSGGDVGTGIKEGLAAGVGGGALSLVGEAIPTLYRKLYPAELPETVEDPEPVYDTLHQGVRDALDKVAQDEGVNAKPSASIRDVVKNTANAIRQKASGLYKQMDDALLSMSDNGEDLPGRFQKFDEDIDKLTDKISDAIGEPEKQQQYAEALDQVKANKQIALQKIKDAGLPEDLPEQAAAIHKRARALEDLSKTVQSSTDGLRPEFSKPGSDATPERIDPVKLSRGLNRLYDNTRYGGRRLVQALGDGAEDLLSHADAAKNALERISDRAEEQAAQAAKIAAQRARARAIVVGTAAASAGLGTLLSEGSKIADLVKRGFER